MLQHFDTEKIQPCNYSFSVFNLDEAVRFASTFISVALETAQDIAQRFTKNGDVDLMRGIASVIDQEREQERFYQMLQEKIPNELLFLTTSVQDFVFTAIQRFIIPGSCSDQQYIDLQTFKSLDLLSTPAAETATVKFSYELHPVYSQNQTLSAVYINQQNLPIVEPIMIDSVEGRIVTAKALFPYNQNDMNGLTILSLTNSTGPFQNAEAVANATVFRPAFIIVN